MRKHKILILGAAGRDFHNFNVVYRKDRQVEVVAFTASQIPGIAGRRYPPSLAGRFYPEGIPIEEEKDLEKLIEEKGVEECVLSYSDLSYNTVMHLASRVIAAGAKFSMLGADQTMLKSSKPVVAIVAVRTGCGKSQTTRRVVEILREAGKKVVAVRHPMPYGDLEKEKVERYKTLRDLRKYDCTIEEMEEFEPHIMMGSVIYTGIDYGAILRKVEKEAEIIVWDGGNNDTSFYKPDVTITVADPLRAGHEISYYPGEVNFRLADAIVINKIDSAQPAAVQEIIENAEKYNDSARIIKAESVITLEKPELVKNKKVLVVEDGPTLTHGDMKIGAGVVAAERAGAAEIVDPRPWVAGTIRETFARYPGIGPLLPAMGYGEAQRRDLEETINRVECNSVVIGTPIDLGRFIKIEKPYTRVRYELAASAKEELRDVLRQKQIVQ
jgi:predicted GTPase